MKASRMQAGARLTAHESAAILAAGGPDPSPSPRSGTGVVVGGYRLGSVLSRNSTIVVCEASRRGRRYALKIARAEAGAATRARLAREYRLGSMLEHPQIASPLAWIADSAAAGIVFDYLPGGDLVSVAGAGLRHWAPALHDVALALRYLHGHRLVHRDVKARNVLFDAGGRAVLIDLGSCRAAGSKWTVGGTTAGHRRPGQPATVEPGDDVYAYAMLVREMLGRAADDSGGGIARSRLIELVAEALTSPGQDPDAKLGAFAAVLESASEETLPK